MAQHVILRFAKHKGSPAGPLEVNTISTLSNRRADIITSSKNELKKRDAEHGKTVRGL